MTVSGSLFNGNGNGEYEIDFAQSQWPDQSGSWTGNLNNGEGVTPTVPVNPPSNPNPEDNATSVLPIQIYLGNAVIRTVIP